MTKISTLRLSTDLSLFRGVMSAESRRLSALHLLVAGDDLPSNPPVSPSMGLVVDHVNNVLDDLLEHGTDSTHWRVDAAIAQRTFAFLEAILEIDEAITNQDVAEHRPIRMRAARCILAPKIYAMAELALRNGCVGSGALPIPRLCNRDHPWLPAPWAPGLARRFAAQVAMVTGGAIDHKAEAAWAAAMDEPGVAGREMARAAQALDIATEEDYLSRASSAQRAEVARWCMGSHRGPRPSTGLRIPRLGLTVRVRDFTIARLPHIQHLLVAA